jgi:hypothetical protein
MYVRVAKELQGDRSTRDQPPPEKAEEPPGLKNDPRERAKQNGNMIQGSFEVEEAKLNGRSLNEVRSELASRVASKNLDGFIILPPTF